MVTLGVQKLEITSQNSASIDEFLAGLRFKQKGVLADLPFAYPKAIQLCLSTEK